MSSYILRLSLEQSQPRPELQALSIFEITRLSLARPQYTALAPG